MTGAGVGPKKWSNLDFGWVKVMCGELGEVSGIIDLVINFLAGGTLSLNSYDTLSYVFSTAFCLHLIFCRV